MYKVNKLTQHISLAGGVEANPGKRDVSLRHESHKINICMHITSKHVNYMLYNLYIIYNICICYTAGYIVKKL